MPNEFWVNVVEPQLVQALADFEKHQENIDKTLFLDDFTRCFMSLSMTGNASEKLWASVSKVMRDNIEMLNNLTIENLTYALSRSRRKDNEFWTRLVQHAVKYRLVVDDKINEFCLLLGVLDNQVENEEFFKHLDDKFARLMEVGEDEEAPVDLIALYANVLSRVKTTEEKKAMWDKVDAIVAASEKKFKQKK